MDRRHFDSADGRDGPPSSSHLRASGRRQCARRDRDAGEPDAPGRAGRQRDPRPRVHGAAPEGLRADRLRPRLLPRRPVVPEDRGVRGRGNTGTCAGEDGTATSSTPTRSSTRTTDATGSRSPSPRHFVVGATGQRVDRRENPDATTTHAYEQADVHDFAWTADPSFVEVKRTFSAETDVTPAEYAETAQLLDRTTGQVRLSDVEMTFLLQPQHLPQLERLVAAARLALKHFGLAYGRYPYPTLTVVDPAKGGMGSGGDGVPDSRHGRDVVPGQSLALRPRAPAPGRDRPRDRPPVLVRARGEQRVRGGVAGRGVHLLFHEPGHGCADMGRTPRWASCSAFASARSKRPARRTGPSGSSTPSAGRAGRTRHPAATRSIPTHARSSSCGRSRAGSARGRWLV